MTEHRHQGQYVKKLIVRFMSVDAVPSGGGFSDGMRFLLDPERIMRSARESTAKAFAAIDAVKAAPDNPYGDDDEAIARAIIERLERRNGPRE